MPYTGPASAFQPGSPAALLIDARVLRAAMEDALGGSDAEGAVGLEGRLRGVRGRAGPVSASVRPGDARPAGRCARLAMLGKVAALAADPHAALGGEPGDPAVLDADAARLRRGAGGRDHRRRPRAGALGRHRACSPSSPSLPAPRSILNELADTRADLLARLFPAAPVTPASMPRISTTTSTRPSARPWCS